MANDKTFVQLVGTAGKDPESRQAGDNTILVFPLAVPTGYGDENKDMWVNVNAWPNTRDDRGDFQAWIRENIGKGSKGIYVEGLLTEKPGNKPGQTFRDVSVSRIGLVEFAERSRALVGAGASSDGEDY